MGNMESDHDWLGNLINAMIFQVIGGVVMSFGMLLNILGMHSFFYDTMEGFATDLFAPDATSWSKKFNSAVVAVASGSGAPAAAAGGASANQCERYRANPPQYNECLRLLDMPEAGF